MKRIYLDLDDVLNNLSLDLLRFDGLDFPNYAAIGQWKWGYDIIEAVSELSGEPRMAICEYWSRIPRKLWADTRLSENFHDILNFCDDKVGLENVLIVTSPTKCPECMAGKFEWIERNLPSQLHRQWSITPRKWEYGRDSEGVLIDDLPANCRKFVTPTHGERRGHTIVVPRPWNYLRTTNVMDAIITQWDYIEQYNHETV